LFSAIAPAHNRSMREMEIPRPAVTVATVVERDGRYLFVEEQTKSGLKINQPAGHLEAAESLASAAARETIEETGWTVDATALIGIYRWQADDGATFVRFAFAATPLAHDASRPLDEGIVRALWLSYAELVEVKRAHRSPLVLRCVDHYRAGRRMPLDLITEIG
jgi:8-oxo-dGTP pyrophosphatase MutT (NUDIX family)